MTTIYDILKNQIETGQRTIEDALFWLEQFGTNQAHAKKRILKK